jgi:hypothetical protein
LGALDDEFCSSLLTSVEHFAGGGDARGGELGNGLIHQLVGRPHGVLDWSHTRYRHTGCWCGDNGQAGMDCSQGVHVQHVRPGSAELRQVLRVR